MTITELNWINPKIKEFFHRYGISATTLRLNTVQLVDNNGDLLAVITWSRAGHCEFDIVKEVKATEEGVKYASGLFYFIRDYRNEILEAVRCLNPKMFKLGKFNHALTIAFSIDTDNDADNLTKEELISALKTRVSELEHSGEILEAAEVYDTYEN